MINIQLINFTSVGIFGMILSAAFCDIRWTKKKIFALSAGGVMILLFQGVVYILAGSDIAGKLYPFITHIPLAVLLCVLNRKCFWPTVSVLIAYLCCQLRRWLALFVVALFGGGAVMQGIVELALTFPILLILIVFFAPAVRYVSHYPISMQCQFGMVPALYYGFDYLTRIYTDLLLEGVLVAVEFMPFVCSAAYLFFVIHISEERRTRSQLEQTQMILNMQIGQAVREIAALRESQEKTRTYHHDMRHHLQYLSSCIENGQFKQAQGYIQGIYSQIEANKVTAFCENEAVNLIFSTFAKRAGDSGVLMKVKAAVPRSIPVSETDLCVLLSNALENALRACKELREEGRDGAIEVSMYEKRGKLFLQMINSCGGDIAFEKGLPVANRAGHGIGVRSICAIVEQYGGIYTFSAGDGEFILRISI